VTKSDRKLGFTLIELLVVIAIIGVLASVVLASLNSARDKGMVAAAQAELDGLRKAFEILYFDTGMYPNGAGGLCADYSSFDPNTNEVDLSLGSAELVADGSSWSNWNGPYVQDAIDPWGTPYYLDEDYECLPATVGCKGIDDGGSTDSSVIVSCGPNQDIDSNACAYDDDNVVYLLCGG